MEELRAHVRKYGPVMQRYYVQYLSGFDAVVLNELVQVWQDHGLGPGFFVPNVFMKHFGFVDFDKCHGIRQSI